MKEHFKLKLTFTMIIFALVISITLATSNYYSLKNQAVTNEDRVLQEKINLLVYAIDTSEKANFLIKKNIAATMEDNTLQLQELYEQTPSFDEWDFSQLSKHISLDIFIINESNIITHSNVEQDIGLNFNKCCSKLAKVLDERRASGAFYDDGFDVEQSTGMIKKYSYMSTGDKKYIIQLGYTWQNGPFFDQFNFLNTIEKLKSVHSSIYDIHLLNMGGIPLGISNSTYSLIGDRRAAFEHTLASGETSKIIDDWNNEAAVFLYVRYSSEYDKGTTQNKVLEIIYSDQELLSILTRNKQAFVFKIIIILLVTVLLAFIISRWVAKPIHMAFHDQLTNLGNRAYFEEFSEKILTANIGTTALLMIDVDNFKLINDNLGHDIGDKLLQQTAQLMQASIRDKDMIFRLGGDEFIVVMPQTNTLMAVSTAEQILQAFELFIQSENTVKAALSLSIGIAFAPEDGIDIDTLTKKADIALYKSKNSGKNQYQLYEDKLLLDTKHA